jgi:hypothetical protein
MSQKVLILVDMLNDFALKRMAQVYGADIS